MLSAEGLYINSETGQRMFQLPNDLGYINEASARAFGWGIPDTLLD